MSHKELQGEIKYPLSFDLKVIMISEHGDNKNIVELDSILDDLAIKLNRNWLSKKSKTGTYTTYAGNITVTSQDQMHSLYSRLKAHPSVKFAL